MAEAEEILQSHASNRSARVCGTGRLELLFQILIREESLGPRRVEVLLEHPESRA